jgi:putative intracellular protease/amidase
MKKLAFLIFTALTLSCPTADAQKQNKKDMKKVLFVVTSHDKLGNTGEKTGFWTEELAAPYYALIDNGVEIDITTPLGGQPPIDPKSEDPSAATEDTKRYDGDKVLLEKLKNTNKLSEVNQADYDAVFYPGGHGPLWDLAEDENSAALIASFYTNNKPVSFVCHAPAALKNVKINGEFLVQGKNVTGFSNTEEEVVGLTSIVPFLLEDVLQQNGATYTKAEDWHAYAVEDGLLITGQNPASSKLVAEKLLHQLHSK